MSDKISYLFLLVKVEKDEKPEIVHPNQVIVTHV